MTIDTPWMKVPEVQAYSRHGRREVLEALNDGTLLGYQTTAGGTWRVHRDDVDAWLRGQAPASKVDRFMSGHRGVQHDTG